LQSIASTVQARGITIILRCLVRTSLSVRVTTKHVKWTLSVALCVQKKVLSNLRYITFVYDIILSVVLLLKFIPNLHFLVILCDLFLFEAFNVDGLDIVFLIIDLLWNNLLNNLATDMLCTIPVFSLVQLLSECWGLPCEGLMGFLCQVANTLVKKFIKRNKLQTQILL
jgi:hypothetical protein